MRYGTVTKEDQMVKIKMSGYAEGKFYHNKLRTIYTKEEIDAMKDIIEKAKKRRDAEEKKSRHMWSGATIGEGIEVRIMFPKALCKFTRKGRLVDLPDELKSHTIPSTMPGMNDMMLSTYELFDFHAGCCSIKKMLKFLRKNDIDAQYECGKLD
jgi:hypothetical protein